MRERVAEFNLEKVHEFMHQAALCCKKKYFSDDAWTRMVALRNQETFSILWQTRVDLFRDIESSLHENPDTVGTKALALRWIAFLDAASGGDPGVKSGLMQAWADRPNWSATIRWMEEGLSMMATERFEKAADFIDKAVAEIAGSIECKLCR
jgi:hypothetical protein